MRNVISRALGARVLVVGVTVAAVAAAWTPSAVAAPVPLAQQQADAAVASMIAGAPSAAARPGAAAGPVLGSSLTTPGGVVVSAHANGCGEKAKELAAGAIGSYVCSEPVVKRIPAATPNVSWPSQCSSGTGTLTGWLAVDRRNACDHVEIDIVTTQHPSGTVIGTTDLHAVSTMSAATTSATWATTSYLWLWSFTGVGAPDDAIGSMFPTCSVSTCLGENETWTPLSDGESWRGTGNAVISGLTTGKVDPGVGGFWEYTLSGAGWGNSVTVDNNLAGNRCDNATAGTSVPGCVFSNIAGLLAFSQTTVPQFVNHIYGAQVSGLPGRLSTGTYLTRLTDPSLSAKNGSKACPGSGLPNPPAGYNCDEYPFRSTYQGAYTSGATLARSLPGCHMKDPQRTGATGWSRCYILATQNSSAGGTTGAFYRSQRMLTHDPFEIGYLA